MELEFLRKEVGILSQKKKEKEVRIYKSFNCIQEEEDEDDDAGSKNAGSENESNNSEEDDVIDDLPEEELKKKTNMRTSVSAEAFGKWN